jgi:hypothetical protein
MRNLFLWGSRSVPSPSHLSSVVQGIQAILPGRAIMRGTRAFLLVICFALASAPPADASKVGRDSARAMSTSSWSDAVSQDNPLAVDGAGLSASAAATTLVMATYRFNSGATCTANSWTTVDLTAQTGVYWHVDDMVGLSGASTGGIAFAPIQGSKSLWMGARPATTPTLCSYLALPGYGSNWNQLFCSNDCLTTAGGATADLDVSFLIHFDSEPGYDATSLEYTTDCSGNTGWTEIDGGVSTWTGPGTLAVVGSYPVGPGPVKVRLRFTSDTMTSNQDGLYPGLGAMIDNLSWETTTVEDFEGEAVGSSRRQPVRTTRIFARTTCRATGRRSRVRPSSTPAERRRSRHRRSSRTRMRAANILPTRYGRP